jgi:hypothetical protein
LRFIVQVLRVEHAHDLDHFGRIANRANVDHVALLRVAVKQHRRLPAHRVDTL